MTERVTGIPRRLMDPADRFLIAHNGSRWEVVAIVEGGRLVPWGPGDIARKRSADVSLGDGAQEPPSPS